MRAGIKVRSHESRKAVSSRDLEKEKVHNRPTKVRLLALVHRMKNHLLRARLR